MRDIKKVRFVEAVKVTNLETDKSFVERYKWNGDISIVGRLPENQYVEVERFPIQNFRRCRLVRDHREPEGYWVDTIYDENWAFCNELQDVIDHTNGELESENDMLRGQLHNVNASIKQMQDMTFWQRIKFAFRALKRDDNDQ